MHVQCFTLDSEEENVVKPRASWLFSPGTSEVARQSGHPKYRRSRANYFPGFFGSFRTSFKDAAEVRACSCVPSVASDLRNRDIVCGSVSNLVLSCVRSRSPTFEPRHS